MNGFSKFLLSIVILFFFFSCGERKSTEETKQENKTEDIKQENKNDKAVNLPGYSIIRQDYENNNHKIFDVYLKDFSDGNASIIFDKFIDENKEEKGLASIGIGFWDTQLSKEAIENLYNSGSKKFIPAGTRTIQGYYSIKPVQKRLDPIDVL